MTEKEIIANLRTLHDEKPTDFTIKKINEGGDVQIESNRNGILELCEMLLESIDKGFSEFPDGMFDDSDVWLSVKIKGKDTIPAPRKTPLIESIGCFLALALGVVVFIVGIVASIKWIAGIF